MTYRLSQKRVLVTGATGFIGSKLVHRLLAQGCEVHIVTRANSDLQVLDTVLNTITVHRHDGTSSG
ncbi:MAG: NAD-dependent epimerase/dehydratase family protein, partial [Flammeovirgaceae bacterium]